MSRDEEVVESCFGCQGLSDVVIPFPTTHLLKAIKQLFIRLKSSGK